MFLHRLAEADQKIATAWKIALFFSPFFLFFFCNYFLFHPVTRPTNSSLLPSKRPLKLALQTSRIHCDRGLSL